jgi:hypothetical protein
MIHRDSLHRHVHASSVGRRKLLAGLAGGGIALAAALRSGSASSPPAALKALATPAADELSPPVGKTFVGPTSDSETLIAIVLRDEAGEAVAYLCRGPELNIWFTGQLQDDALALTGAPQPGETTFTGSAPTLTGRITADGLSGEALLPEATLTFTGIPATGIARLYVAERDESGAVRGAASTGATLEAQQNTAEGASAAAAPYRIVGTVTLADGRQMPIEIPARTEAAAIFRWVALADGRVRGAGKRRRQGDGNGFIESGVEL